jgi:hypothetical protein
MPLVSVLTEAQLSGGPTCPRSRTAAAALYFTAGPNGEMDGLFGSLVPSDQRSQGNQNNQGNQN